MTRHVVKFSGGEGSAFTAHLVAERHGLEDLTLLFTDTLAEDTDLYRFLCEAACLIFGMALPQGLRDWINTIPEWHEDRFGRRAKLDTLRADMREILPQLVWISCGMDPWEIFRKERFLGNSSIDPCSKIAKRMLADAWLAENCDPADTVIYIGIDWTEKHRFDAPPDPKTGHRRGAKHRWAERGWRAEAPMAEGPNLYTRREASRWVQEAGIRRPALTVAGFPHNNCSGGCCKAGQTQWTHLHRVAPARFAFHEQEETTLVSDLGGGVAMLTDRSGDGLKKPLLLSELRRRIETGGTIDMFEWGGCGCMLDEEDA